MRFRLEFDCDNAAFFDDSNNDNEFNPNNEIAGILIELGKKYRNNYSINCTIFDSNGNKIGKAKLIED